ncbi:hypothetical protein PS2_033970 [Malus domestica]
MDSLEPGKLILEKDHNAAIVSEIDQTMKKHTDNLLHVLEGVSARLTQLESRTRNLENSVNDLKISVGNNHGNTDGTMRQLEDWETMLSETAESPAHDQSLLRWIAGDVDDMSCGLKQLLQSGKGNHHNSPIDFDSNAGLGIVDQSPNFDLIGSSGI